MDSLENNVDSIKVAWYSINNYKNVTKSSLITGSAAGNIIIKSRYFKRVEGSKSSRFWQSKRWRREVNGDLNQYPLITLSYLFDGIYLLYSIKAFFLLKKIN